MYKLFTVTIKGGKTLDVIAISMESAAADVTEAFANAEIIQVMAR